MIRFTKPNHYRRQVGDIVDTFPYGVEHTLVRRGIAEFVDADMAVVAAISEPIAEQPQRRKRRKDLEEN